MKTDEARPAKNSRSTRRRNEEGVRGPLLPPALSGRDSLHSGGPCPGNLTPPQKLPCDSGLLFPFVWRLTWTLDLHRRAE